MNAPAMTPEEFRARLAQMTAAELAAAHRDPALRNCIEAEGEHAAVWKEAVALHSALDAFDVPQPRTNIAARTMAAIAVAERAERRPSATARIRELFASRMAVPAWGVAAALALLVASAALNVAQLKHDGSGGAAVAGHVSPAPTPQVIFVDPAENPSGVVQARGSAVPSIAEPMPALVVIMGVPPSADGLGGFRFQTIDSASERKENSI